MRTTLELPEPLFQRAKLAALQRKITFKTLVTQALSRELDAGPSSPRRMTTPPIQSNEGDVIPALSNRQIGMLMEEEEGQKVK